MGEMEATTAALEATDFGAEGASAGVSRSNRDGGNGGTGGRFVVQVSPDAAPYMSRIQFENRAAGDRRWARTDGRARNVW